MNRRMLMAALAVTVTSAGLVGVPEGSAFAASDFGIYQTYDTNDAAALYVIDATGDPESFTATLSKDGVDVLTLPTDAWHRTILHNLPVYMATPPADLPEGTYDVTVDEVIHLTNGYPDITRSSTSTFDYVENIHPSGASIEHATRDWANQNAIVTGRLVHTRANGTLINTVPEAEVTGTLVDYGYPTRNVTWKATTDADGTYHYSVPAPAPMHDYSAVTVGAQDFPLSMVKTQTRVTLDKPSQTVLFNTPVTVSGKAEYLDPASQEWRPLVGLRVGARYIGEATPDSDGRFAFTYQASQDVGTQLEIEPPDFRDQALTDQVNQYLRLSNTRLAIDEYDKATISLTSATIGADSRLRLAGKVSRASGSTSGIRLEIQESSDGRTWTTVGAGFSQNGAFTYTKALSTPRGYFRVHVPRDATQLESNSAARHLVRTATRITSINAAPEPVLAGKPITVSGNLQKKPTSTWTAFVNQKVLIYFRPEGSTKFTYKGYDYTDSKGHFMKRFTAQWDGYWRAVYRTPNGSYLDALSGEDYVAVDH